MAFKEVSDLSADTTISLGGVNKKTNKANPTKIEGYYLGKKQVADKKKKSGTSYIYIFQTAKGNVGVWGKTDLDRKMAGLTPGSMTRVTQAGMTPTPNGDMYKYKVEFDPENTIEVVGQDGPPAFNSDEGLDDGPGFNGNARSFHNTSNGADDEDYEQEEDDEEEAFTPPPKASGLSASERQAKVQALLGKGKK